MPRKCTVCDSPNATNYHFGARSCKACAAFFRRSIAMKQSYACENNKQGPCRINYALRLNCRKCRLQKCYDAGMRSDLVQAKREIRKSSESNEIFNNSQYHYQSENEFGPDPSCIVANYETGYGFHDVDIQPMSTNELQQYIKIDKELTEWFHVSQQNDQKNNTSCLMADSFYTEDNSFRSRFNSISEPLQMLNVNFNEYQAEDNSYELINIYMEQQFSLNMRRKITYTEKFLSSFFDSTCICPYEKSDLKLFDPKTYRLKNKHDYTMILDYISQYPDFNRLTNSEKTVLFRTACAVDLLVDQSYYSLHLFGNENALVTPNGECFLMEPLPNPEAEIMSDRFQSEEEFQKYKSLLIIKRRQWLNVVLPIKSLQPSFPEYCLFKALVIWHHNYYKMQTNGRNLCIRQRDAIIRCFSIICRDEGYENIETRIGEIILAASSVMVEIHEMITSYLELTFWNTVDEPVLKDMLKFQY